MVCLSGRELRNTTPNLLIMFVLNTNFADPNNQTGYPSRKSANKSGATCFETVDDLGGADGLAGNSLEARSQDNVTNFGMVEDDIKFPFDEGDLACHETYSWHDWYEKVNSNMPKSGMTYSDKISKELTIPDKQCQCGFDPDCVLAPWQNPGSQSNSTTLVETELANVI